jgi:hypothetical protein
VIGAKCASRLFSIEDKVSISDREETSQDVLRDGAHTIANLTREQVAGETAEVK